MAKKQRTKAPSRNISRLTVIAIILLLAAGAVIIILDRRQFSELLKTSNWSFLIGAVVFTAASYLSGGYSFVLMVRAFGGRIKGTHLLNIGITSLVLLNLIGQPAGLSLRLLLLGRHNFKSSDAAAASILLSYFKNLFYFSLIPFSLLYIIFSHPLRGLGTATILVIMLVLIALLVVATGIIFNKRLREITLRIIAGLWRTVARRDITAYLEQLSQALTSGIGYLKKERAIRVPLAASIILDVVATIAALWFCITALGIAVQPGVLITAFNFGITLTIISFIPGDMGVQEASVAGVMALFGVPFAQGVIAAILFRIVYYFIPFIFTLPVYWYLLREKTR